MTLPIKFRILQTLLNSNITDIHNKDIDNEFFNGNNHILYNMPRAWSAAYCYFHDIPISKSDLQYCNKTIKKLIKIVGTDENIITATYIGSVLLFNKKPYKVRKEWIESYFKLLKFIKNESGQ